MDIIFTFNKILQEEPVSTLIAFEKALEISPLKKTQIRKYFNKLVNKKDYLKKDKDKIVNQIKGRIKLN